jgi:ankyrin repeat protein
MSQLVKAARRFLILAVAVLLAPAQSFAAPDHRLADAAEKRDKDVVRRLLQQHVDVNTPQPDGATAIAWAAHWDDLDLADLLIRAGADVKRSNDLGVSPLFLACTNGSAPMVKKLLQAGADAKSQLPTGETAIMTAAAAGNVEVVKALVSRGADVNAKESYKGQTALMWAISRQHDDVAQALVEIGANVHARSEGGSTALHFAARTGNVKGADILLKAGADVNEAMPDGSTALLLASASGHEAVGIFLLDHGADPNLADKNIGMTPLHGLVWRQLDSHVPLAKALLAHGANPNARLKKAPQTMQGENGPSLALWNGATPFVMAARVADVPLMRALKEGGADPLITTTNKTTALMAAAGVGRSEGSELPTFGTFPISDQRALDAVTVAAELGVSPRATDEKGFTALHGAVQNGHNTVIQFLADHGADLNAKDAQGRTPLSLARYVQINFREHKESAALLLKLGAADVPAPPAPVATRAR